MHPEHASSALLVKRGRSQCNAGSGPRKTANRIACRIAKLEVEVTDVKRERDELRVQLAREKAEAAVLREMLRLANTGSTEKSQIMLSSRRFQPRKIWPRQFDCTNTN